LNKVILKKEFEINGLKYLAMLSKSGEFGSELIGGNSRKGSTYDRKRALSDLYYHDTSVIDDVNLNSNCLPVFRKAGEILIGWLHEKKLWRVGFSASTARKVKVYRWFANRLAAKLMDYEMVESPVGAFSFYRRLA
jgi:hypothetical protein